MDFGNAFLPRVQIWSLLIYGSHYYENYKALILCAILKQVVLWLKLAQCHTAVESNVDAIRVYQKGMSSMSEQAFRRFVCCIFFEFEFVSSSQPFF